MALVVRIVRLNILSKLTFTDCYYFDELVKDTFPGIDFESSGHSHLVKAIRDSYKEIGLIRSERQVSLPLPSTLLITILLAHGLVRKLILSQYCKL